MSSRIPLILPIAKGGGGTSGTSNVSDEFVLANIREL